MKYFSKNLYNQLLKFDIKQYTIITPTQISKVSLKNNLEIDGLNGIVWSIEDFRKNQLFKLDFRSIEKISACYTLFELLREVNPNSEETFDKFIAWGYLMLNDFSDIDLYVDNPDMLLRNIEAIKCLEATGSSTLNHDNLSDLSKKFLNNWEVYNSLYHKINEFAFKNKIIPYYGFGLKLISNSLKKLRIDESFIFVGFNKLSKPLRQIINELVENNGSKVIFNDNSFFYDTNFSGAEIYSLDNKKDFRLKNQEYELEEINVKVQKVSVAHAEIRVLSKILQNELNNNIAVVYCDINQTKQSIKTIGELKQIGYIHNKQLIEANDSIKFSTTYLEIVKRNSEKKGYIYFKYVNQLLNNSLFKISNKISKDDNDTISSIVKNIFDNKMIFIKESWLNQQLSKYLNINDFKLLSSSTNPSVILSQLISIFSILRDKYEYDFESSNKISFTIELLFDTLDELKLLSNSLNLESLILLFEEKVSSTYKTLDSISSEGVFNLSLNEISCLSFDKVVFLSANESNLPSKLFSNSYIPIDIKKDYGLPLPKESGYIVAHDVYSMLFETKELDFVFSTTISNGKEVEPSRYIRQIKEIFPLNYKGNIINYKEFTYSYQNVENEEYPIVINKEELNLKEFEDAFKEFSPSKIITLLECSLKFYFRYIKNVKKEKELSEIIEADVFGNVLHKTMELIYKPYINQALTSDIINSFVHKVESNLQQAFIDLEYADYKDTNKLIVVYLVEAIKKIIQVDSKKAKESPFIIKDLEFNFNEATTLFHSKEKKSIKIKGIIDRVQIRNGELELIDYKTGSVKDLFVFSDSNEINQFKTEDIEGSSIPYEDRKEAIQLNLYMLMYKQLMKVEKISAHIISIKKINNSYQKVNVFKKESYENELIDFNDFIIDKVIELYQSMTFSQRSLRENDKVCQYCDFVDICNRN